METQIIETRTADISPCGRYRYRLERIWNPERAAILFVMLNPSTADAEVDDPTIRRCRSFAQREAAGGIVVVNLFALRATSPGAISVATDPIGPRNDHEIDMAAATARRIVAAWGSSPAKVTSYRRDLHVLARLRAKGEVVCLGTTQGGAPRHPLYVRADQPFEVLHAYA